MLEKLIERSFASSSGSIYNCTSIDSPSGQSASALRAIHCESLSVSQSASALRADGVFTQAFMNSVSPVLKQIEKHVKRLDSNGSACTYDILKQFSVDNVKIDDAWKGDNPNLVMSAGSSAPLSQILADLLNTSDLVVLEVVGMCDEYKTQALRVKCSLSTKNGGLSVFLNCLETLALESYTGMLTARMPLHQSHCTSRVPCTKRLTVL